jgi:hypothetical protein
MYPLKRICTQHPFNRKFLILGESELKIPGLIHAGLQICGSEVEQILITAPDFEIIILFSKFGNKQPKITI